MDTNFVNGQTALVLPVEGFTEIEAFRAKHEPSAKHGVQAHVTLIVPFLSTRRIDNNDVKKLKDFFKATPAIKTGFSKLDTFPDVIYLSPDNPQPIVDCVKEIYKLFPETPPYEGRFRETIPHLTLAAYNQDNFVSLFQKAQSLSIKDTVLDRAIIMAYNGSRFQQTHNFDFSQTF